MLTETKRTRENSDEEANSLKAFLVTDAVCPRTPTTKVFWKWQGRGPRRPETVGITRHLCGVEGEGQKQEDWSPQHPSAIHDAK